MTSEQRKIIDRTLLFVSYGGATVFAVFFFIFAVRALREGSLEELLVLFDLSETEIFIAWVPLIGSVMGLILRALVRAGKGKG